MRIDLGVVEQTQRDRIDSGRVGELVHRALERKMPERLVGRTHRRRRVAVHVDDLVVGRYAAAAHPIESGTQSAAYSM